MVTLRERGKKGGEWLKNNERERDQERDQEGGRVRERDKGWGKKIKREWGRRLNDHEGEEAIEQNSMYH